MRLAYQCNERQSWTICLKQIEVSCEQTSKIIKLGIVIFWVCCCCRTWSWGLTWFFTRDYFSKQLLMILISFPHTVLVLISCYFLMPCCLEGSTETLHWLMNIALIFSPLVHFSGFEDSEHIVNCFKIPLQRCHSFWVISHIVSRYTNNFMYSQMFSYFFLQS